MPIILNYVKNLMSFFRSGKVQLPDFFRYHLPFIFSILSFWDSYETDVETSGPCLHFSHLFCFLSLTSPCHIMGEFLVIFFFLLPQLTN